MNSNFVRSNTRIGLILAVLIFGSVAIQNVYVNADDSWINSSGGFYNNGTNWESGSPPSISEELDFGINGEHSYNVFWNEETGSTFSSDIVVGNNVSFLSLSDFQNTFSHRILGGMTVSQHNFSVGNNPSTAFDLTIDNDLLLDIATVNVKTGSNLVANNIYLFYFDSTLSIDGSQSQVTAGNIEVGGASGAMYTSNVILNNGATAISTNARFTTDTLGSEATSSFGSMSNQSTWLNSSEFFVGRFAKNGSIAGFFVLSGSQLFTDDLFVGFDADGFLEISGPGSIVNANNYALVGVEKPGALVVSHGGQLNAAFFRSRNTVVQNPNSSITANELNFTELPGSTSTSIDPGLSVLDGAFVDASSTVIEQDITDNDLTIVVDGQGSELSVGDLESTVAGTTSIRVENGGRLSAESMAFHNTNIFEYLTLDVSGDQSQIVTSDVLSLNHCAANVFDLAELNAGVVYLNGAQINADSNSLISSLGFTSQGSFMRLGNHSAFNAGSALVDSHSSIRIDSSEVEIQGDLVIDGGSRIDLFHGANVLVLGETRLGQESMTGGGQVILGSGTTLTTESLFLEDPDLISTGPINVVVIPTGSAFCVLNSTLLVEGQVSVTGGDFYFGVLPFEQYSRITASDGAVAGRLRTNFPINLEEQFIPKFPASVDVSGVSIHNSETISGSGTIPISVLNLEDGIIELSQLDTIVFDDVLTNEGLIQNLDGDFQTESEFTNAETGEIQGRGSFEFSQALANTGEITFFGGPSNITGSLHNNADGQVTVTGNSTATLFDDLVHNGLNFNVSTGSTMTVLGDVLGSGNFGGQGTVFFEGNYSPGPVYAQVEFDPELILGAGSTLVIDVGGSSPNQNDQITANSDIFLNGSLQVNFAKNLEFSPGMERIILNLNGNRFGPFLGLPEGAPVATVDGYDVLISYEMGDGNDVGLYVDTAILLGDTNLDGVVNILDVGPFVSLLSESAFQAEADINSDGFVNLLDVQLFVDILAN